MKPVDQTIFEDGRGNCLAACVASILELSIEEVPNFREAPHAETTMKEWLAERGYSVFRYTVLSPEELTTTFFDTGRGVYVILGGDGPRKNADGRTKQHAVVGVAAGYGIKIVHDPHPSRAGLIDKGHRFVWLLVHGSLPNAS